MHSLSNMTYVSASIAVNNEARWLITDKDKRSYSQNAFWHQMQHMRFSILRVCVKKYLLFVD